MEPAEPVNDAAAWRPLALLLAAGALLFFWRLGSNDLWPPDEARFALVAREMLERGDPILLSHNNHLYTEKPPLFFWAIGLCALPFGGVNEWAARLPSAAASLLSLVLVYLLGSRLYDRRTGFLGAIVFATACQIAIRARWASIDMLLNLLVLGAILLLWAAAGGGRTAAWRLRAAWVLMGLATLAKGPVGMVVPLLAVVTPLLLLRRFRAARRTFQPSGIALCLLVIGLWFVPFALRLGPLSALEVALHQNVDRYVDAWNTRQPIWFYLWRFPAGFLPWSVFLPWGIAQVLAPEERPRREAAVFLLAWIAAVLLFFSLSTGKRGVYVIPAYPAAALVVGRLLSRSIESGTEGEPARRRLRPPLLAWTGMTVVLAAAAPILALRKESSLVPPAAAVAGCFLAGAVAAAWMQARGRHLKAVQVLAGSHVLACVLTVGLLVPWVDRHKRIRTFATEVKARLHPAGEFGATQQKRDAWVFYTGRFAAVLDTPGSVEAFLGAAGPRDLLIEASELRRVRDRLPPDAEVIWRGRVAGDEYYLLHRAGEAVSRPAATAGGGT